MLRLRKGERVWPCFGVVRKKGSHPQCIEMLRKTNYLIPPRSLCHCGTLPRAVWVVELEVCVMTLGTMSVAPELSAPPWRLENSYLGYL
jgi:hypothetical protein